MNVRQSFLFNTIFALCVNFVIKPVWVFGIDRTVQNELGGDAYGIYFAIFNFTYLFQILLDFGLQNYNQTEIATDNSRFAKLFPGMLSAKLVLTIFYLILTIAAGIILGYAAHSFFPWLILNQILLSFNIFMRSNISAHRLFIKDSFLSVLDKFLMIIGCSFMLIPSIRFIPLTVDNFVWIQTASLAATTLICIYYNLQLSSSFEWKFDIPLFKKIVIQAIPFALIYFLMTIFYRVDTVMIEQLLGDKGAREASIYAQSYRIMESVNNIGYIVSGVLLPLFAFQLGKKENIHQILKQGYNIMFTVIIPIVVGGVFYAKDIIHTLYPGEDPTYSGEIFTILLLNFIPVGLLYVLGPLLTAKRLFRIMIPSLTIASIMNVVVNLVLIPKYGAYGAAITTFGTQIFMLTIYWLATYFLFQLNINWKTIARSASYILLAIAMNYGMKSTNIFWLYGLAITGFSSLLISLLLKIISKETLSLKIGD